MMRAAGAGPDGTRLRALIIVLWRAGLRIGEPLARSQTDMDARRGAILVRHGKGNKRREVGWTAGAGNNSSHGSTSMLAFPSDHCSA